MIRFEKDDWDESRIKRSAGMKDSHAQRRRLPRLNKSKSRFNRAGAD